MQPRGVRKGLKWCGAGAAVVTAVTVVAGSAAAGAASSNGIANQSASQILSAAFSATAGASSFTVDGIVTASGQQAALQIAQSSTGKGALTIDFQGLSIDAIFTPTTVYVRAPAAFWQQAAGSQAASQLGGQWISVPFGDSHLNALGQTPEGGKFVAGQLPDPSDSGTVATKGATTTVSGQPAIRVTVSNPSHPNDNGVLYVATMGKPYILRFIGATNSAAVLLTFSNYGKTATVKPPSKSVSLQSVLG
jgi:hypothetical protein